MPSDSIDILVLFMPTIDKEIIINAPIEKVYDYINEPSNLPQIWPSLIEIKNKKLLANGGYGFQWSYKMIGTYLEGIGECTGYAENQWLSIKTGGALTSVMTWTFRVKDLVETRVTFTVDYKIPSPILRWLAGNTVMMINEQEAKLILTNLKTILETKSN